MLDGTERGKVIIANYKPDYRNFKDTIYIIKD